MTDLRTCIATAIAKHDPWDYSGGLECRCTREFHGDTYKKAELQWAEHVAEEVVTHMVRELLTTKMVYRGEPL